jgi:hypothetical protein
VPQLDSIAIRRGTAAAWAAADPVLGPGEPGVELEVDGTLGAFKIGNGVDAWSALAAAGGGGGGLVVLADETKAAAQPSFDFAGLPGGHSGLLIAWSGRSSAAATTDIVLARFNADAGNNYDRQRRENSAPTTLTEVQNLAGAVALVGNLPGDSATAGWAGAGEITIPNYAGTVFHKLVRSKSIARTGAAPNVDLGDQGAIWRSTAAIERVTLTLNTGPNWMIGSRCTIYGLPA